MNIFTQIKNSVYNKEYYKTVVISEPFSHSIKYLAKFSLLLVLFGLIVFSFYIPNIYGVIRNEASNLANTYPEDLIITIQNGEATINQPEPYFFRLPDSIKDSKDEQISKIDNLMTINTTEPLNLDKFKEYSTFSLLTKKEVVTMSDAKGEIRILPLSTFGNVEITKAWVLEKEDLLIKILPWILIGMLIFVYIGIFMFQFIGSLIILLFYALIVWLILKTKKINTTYGISYKIAIHASTLVFTLSMIGYIVKPLNNFWIKMVVLVLIVYLNYEVDKNLPTIEEPVLKKEDEVLNS